MKNYYEIEAQRKKLIVDKINNLLLQRENEKKQLIYNMRTFNENAEKQKHLKIQKKEELTFIKPDENHVDTKFIENPVLENIIQDAQFKIDNSHIQNLHTLEEPVHPKTKAVTEEKTRQTNIPIRDELINKFILPYENIKLPSLTSELIHLKRIINKRITQISADANHTNEIAEELRGYVDNPHFNLLLVQKIVEMGKLQVAIHKESYKSYSYFLGLMYKNNENLLDVLRLNVFTAKEMDGKVLKGIYLIYFGMLKILKLYDEAWFFFASILHVKPEEASLYVLEAFFIIFGKDMINFYGNEYIKLIEVIKTEYFSHIDNDAVKTRIISIVEANKKNVMNN